VHDQDAALEFWTKKVGLELRQDVTMPEMGDFRWLTVGGAVSLFVWAVVSFGFGLYVANFGSYNRTYGSLGAIMAFLAWIYLSNIALLLGVQVNAQVQRGRLRQAGSGDEIAPLAPRLPPDDPGTA